jgi:hypothetical protein
MRRSTVLSLPVHVVFPGDRIAPLSFVYFLVGWHASVVSLPPGDAIFGQLVCPQNVIIFCLHQE